MVEPLSFAERFTCFFGEPDNFVSAEPSADGEHQQSSSLSSSDADEQDGGVDEVKLNEDLATCGDDDGEGDLQGELQGRTCLKDADRPSAGRLAKRLYYLDGFRKCDVSPHLSKKSVKLTS